MEREKDAWTSLTVTPLEGQEILTGKMLGAFWRVRGMLAALLVVWLIGLICGAVHPLGFLLAIVATVDRPAFIAVLGTYVSLRSRSSARAIAATIAILVFLNGGYLFCCAPAMNGPGEYLFTRGGHSDGSSLPRRFRSATSSSSFTLSTRDYEPGRQPFS